MHTDGCVSKSTYRPQLWARQKWREKKEARRRQQLLCEDPTGCSHHEKHCDLIEQWFELREAAHFSCIFLRKNKTTPNSALTLSLLHSIRQGETALILPTSRIFHDTSRFPPIILSSARPTHEIHTALYSKSEMHHHIQCSKFHCFHKCNVDTGKTPSNVYCATPIEIFEILV